MKIGITKNKTQMTNGDVIYAQQVDDDRVLCLGTYGL